MSFRGKIVISVLTSMIILGVYYMFPREHQPFSPPLITVYYKPTCPYCHKAFDLIEQYSINYKKINIQENPDQRQKMIHLAGGKTTVPQIFVGDHSLGGYTDLLFLHEQGTLKQTLTLHLPN